MIKWSLLLFFLFFIFDMKTNNISNLTLSSKKKNLLLTNQKCNSEIEKIINQCLKPILSYANSIQHEADSTQLVIKGGEIFQRLCKLYHKFKKCSQHTICSSISVKAIDASYGYMCGQGYYLFEKHAACFSEVEHQREYIYCKSKASFEMDKTIKLKNVNTKVYFEKLCLIMNEYLRCCRPFVNKKCGSEAWQLVAQITMDSLDVTMPSCNLNHVLF